MNPDGFASEFGHHAVKDDFEAGLRYLLTDDNGRRHGERAYQYTLDTFETSRSLDLHEAVYRSLCKK